HRRWVLLVRVVAESQHAIGLGIVEVHAQSGAGFADGVISVVTLVKNQCQPVVDFGEIRFGLLGCTVFVKSAVPVTLLLFQVGEQKVQRAVVRILGD